ncbi:MAG: glycosyltransferase family 4 protein [Blastocatellia bacterium]|nr:glycosyltransferase family 4 protein [Blastocatellia bacterium]
MEQASLRLMQALQRRGHSFRVLSLNPLGGLAPLLSQSGIPAEGLSYRGKCGWRSFPEIRRRLRSLSADGLLMTGHHLLAMLGLRQDLNENSVLTIHFHHTGVKPLWQWRMIYRMAGARFRAITFPSDFIRREAERIYPGIKEAAHTILYPVSLPELPAAAARNAARADLGLPSVDSGIKIVGNAGWLITRKRWDVFLRVAQLVLRRRPETLFAIAGDGPERSALEKLAVDLEISHAVRWLGWQQNMKDFYHALDVVLFNSDWDAVGLTPLEAMSYGVPVVASIINGGLIEIIGAGNGAALIDRHDVNSLAESLNDLLDSRVRSREAGSAGRECVRRNFDPDKVAIEYERLLQGS